MDVLSHTIETSIGQRAERRQIQHEQSAPSSPGWRARLYSALSPAMSSPSPGITRSSPRARVAYDVSDEWSDQWSDDGDDEADPGDGEAHIAAERPAHCRHFLSNRWVFTDADDEFPGLHRRFIAEDEPADFDTFEDLRTMAMMIWVIAMMIWVGKARLRMHAARLKPHVNIPARLTEERFFPRQNTSRYHWYIAGRAVCQETYAEVCALGESSIQCIRKLALAAAEQDLDLTEDTTPMSDGDVRRGEIDQRSMDVKSFLEDFAQDCCEAIPDGDTVGRLSTDALYDDLDVQHDDDDGGTEWRLPYGQINSARFFELFLFCFVAAGPKSDFHPKNNIIWNGECGASRHDRSSAGDLKVPLFLTAHSPSVGGDHAGRALNDGCVWYSA